MNKLFVVFFNKSTVFVHKYMVIERKGQNN